MTTSALAAVAAGALAATLAATRPDAPRAAWVAATPPPPVAASPSPGPQETVASPAPPEPGLKVIDYGPAPAGFPADPEPASTAPLTEGLHPVRQIPAYDAPGGRARAYLAPTISGVPITMPIVARRADWVAVILPSVNRTIGWLAPGGWQRVDLRDQLVVRRGSHQLSWYRDGAVHRSWTVTLGDPRTPTPLGRTFVLGRSTLPGSVYAGVDVLALGSVPDRADSVPTGLRGAHTGIHAWYRDDTFGKSVSNGCIRLPKTGQQQLLAELAAGTPVIVIE
jgi:hypothetical protein